MSHFLRDPSALLAVFGLVACQGDPGAGIGPSQLDPELTGWGGMYWDLKNGIIRTDLPGGVPPVVDPWAGTYQNPDYPLLSFEYPPGWTPDSLVIQSGAGVNLIRDDELAVWRWFGAPVPSDTTARQVRDGEIELMGQSFGLEGAAETVAVNEATSTPAFGIVQSASNAIVELDGHTAQVTALVTHIDGLITAFAYVELAAAPSLEYEALCGGLTVPLHFRMLLGDNSNIVDSDGDGVADGLDRAPFDPTVQ